MNTKIPMRLSQARETYDATYRAVLCPRLLCDLASAVTTSIPYREQHFLILKWKLLKFSLSVINLWPSVFSGDNAQDGWKCFFKTFQNATCFLKMQVTIDVLCLHFYEVKEQDFYHDGF